MAGETSGISHEDLVKALGRLSVRERQDLLAPTSSASKTPKFSPAIDAVGDDQVDEVVEACKRGLEIAKTLPDPEAQIGPLAEVAPGVAAAARSNCMYRGKSICHSLQVVIDRLRSRASAES